MSGLGGVGLVGGPQLERISISHNPENHVNLPGHQVAPLKAEKEPVAQQVFVVADNALAQAQGAASPAKLDIHKITTESIKGLFDELATTKEGIKEQKREITKIKTDAVKWLVLPMLAAGIATAVLLVFCPPLGVFGVAGLATAAGIIGGVGLGGISYKLSKAYVDGTGPQAILNKESLNKAEKKAAKIDAAMELYNSEDGAAFTTFLETFRKADDHSSGLAVEIDHLDQYIKLFNEKQKPVNEKKEAIANLQNSITQLRKSLSNANLADTVEINQSIGKKEKELERLSSELRPMEEELGNRIKQLQEEIASEPAKEVQSAKQEAPIVKAEAPVVAGGNVAQERNAEKIQEEISENKQRIVDLNSGVINLDKQLEDLQKQAAQPTVNLFNQIQLETKKRLEQLNDQVERLQLSLEFAEQSQKESINEEILKKEQEIVDQISDLSHLEKSLEDLKTPAEKTAIIKETQERLKIKIEELTQKNEALIAELAAAQQPAEEVEEEAPGFAAGQLPPSPQSVKIEASPEVKAEFGPEGAE